MDSPKKLGPLIVSIHFKFFMLDQVRGWLTQKWVPLPKIYISRFYTFQIKIFLVLIILNSEFFFFINNNNKLKKKKCIISIKFFIAIKFNIEIASQDSDERPIKIRNYFIKNFKIINCLK